VALLCEVIGFIGPLSYIESERPPWIQGGGAVFCCIKLHQIRERERKISPNIPNFNIQLEVVFTDVTSETPRILETLDFSRCGIPRPEIFLGSTTNRKCGFVG
jgi:hypothetical protein